MKRYFSFFFFLVFSVTCSSFCEESLKNENPSLEMTWERKEGTFAFRSWNHKQVFEIILTHAQWEKLPKKIQKKFWYKEKKYFFSYNNEEWKEIPYYSEAKRESFLGKNRSFKEARPRLGIPLVELAYLIESKKVLFYTGAGISQAAGIPTMDQLETLFALDAQGKWIADAVQIPEKVIEKVCFFSRLCFERAPTQAHIALASMALEKSIPILTENVDTLHQKTGIQPIFATIKNVQEHISSTSLKETDAIICIGLSKDAIGMLGWYKSQHPKGKIIAIDLNQPEYLGSEDVFIQADAQKILPELHALVKSRLSEPLKG